MSLARRAAAPFLRLASPHSLRGYSTQPSACSQRGWISTGTPTNISASQQQQQRHFTGHTAPRPLPPRMAYSTSASSPSASSLSVSSSPASLSSPPLSAEASTSPYFLVLTDEFAQKLNSLNSTADQNQPRLALRVAVKVGGCNSFEYNWSLVPESSRTQKDIVFERSGAKVYVDPKSLKLVSGSTVHYKQEMIRSSFAVLSNPQAESTCGCGSSFALKTAKAT